MKKGVTAVIIFWLSIVGISFLWNLVDEKREREQLAFETARAFFQQIVITREWNAGHEGVYVPVTDETYPNPFLPESLRDVITEKGLRLTKVNPAYMTRQLAEISAREKGIRFHITSLNPIRLQNKPATWEEAWLKLFEQGEKEKGEFVTEGKAKVFHYMAPLIVDNSCLPCHSKQGYKEGDIRGGISITIPYLAAEDDVGLYIGYGITAIAGVVFTIAGGTMLARRREELVRTNRSLEKGIEEREELIRQLREANSQIKTLSGIIPICMYCKGVRDDEGYWNQVEKFISEHSTAQFSHSICPQCMKERHPGIDPEEEQ